MRKVLLALLLAVCAVGFAQVPQEKENVIYQVTVDKNDPATLSDYQKAISKREYLFLKWAGDGQESVYSFS